MNFQTLPQLWYTYSALVHDRKQMLVMAKMLMDSQFNITLYQKQKRK